MIMRYDLQIQTMIKAMVETVAPAIDPLDPLAQEQARLVIGTLMLMAEQLPLQYRFDVDDLTRMVGFADDLGARLHTCSGPLADAVSALTASAAAGRAVLSRPTVDVTYIVTAARAIRTAADHVVDVVFTDDDARAHRGEVRRVVLDWSRDEILRDRAWTRSQGFEPDVESIPPIESLLILSSNAAVTE
jgi:hypothetical protein